MAIIGFNPKGWKEKITYWILLAFFTTIMLAIPPLASMKDTFPWNLVATLIAILLGSVIAWLLMPKGGG